MNKAELLTWLDKKQEEWELVMDRFDENTWLKPGAAGYWSMKDVLAHLTEWSRWTITVMDAVCRGEPKPSPPWPEDLQTDDAVNAWIYEQKKDSPVDEMIAENRQVFESLKQTVSSFPDDVEIETVDQEGRIFYLVHLNGQRLHPGEFYDHYRDDHEVKIMRFLETVNSPVQ